MDVLLEQEIVEEHDMRNLQDNSFKITDLDGVNWAFRKIRAYQTKKAEIDDLRTKEVERINSWHKAETEQLEGNMVYFKYLITEYYMEARKTDPKIKLSTPYGKVSTRKSTKWDYTNQDETMEYLTSNGYQNMIRVKQELDKTEIKKLFKNGISEDGEIIPGITVKEEEKIVITTED